MANKKASIEEVEKIVQNFRNGSTNFYQHNISRLIYTDGIKELADKAGSYWLIDAIASYQPKASKDRDLNSFQLWMLHVGKEPEGKQYPFIKPRGQNKAILTCWYDTPEEGLTPPIRQQIPYTDFPLKEIQLYVRDRVLMLPTEY